MGAVHSLAVDIDTTEINYKCLARWYITPIKAQKYQTEKSALCWRGCSSRGNMVHIWRECSKIQDYWQKVQQYIREIAKTEIAKDLRLCLFQNTNSTRKQYKSTIVPYILNAAKEFPKKLLDPESPTMREWFERIEYTYKMEYLCNSKEDQMERFSSIGAK